MRKVFSTMLAATALAAAGIVAGGTTASAATTAGEALPTATTAKSICVQGHIQDVGWETGWYCDGNLYAGTTGQNKHLEALRIVTYNAGGVCAQAYVQNIEWQAAQCAGDGQVVTIGTTGQNLQIEAVSLWGNGSTVFSANAHLANVGWLGWTPWANGVVVGTAHQNRAMEAISLEVA